MKIDHNIKFIDIADSIIINFNDFDMTGKWDVLNKSGLSEHIIQNNDFLTRPIHQAFNLLEEDLEYIVRKGENSDWYSLTDLGRLVKKAGGHFEYLKLLDSKSNADNLRQERKDKADELDLQIKTWQVKTKYLPYIASFLALTISIFSYFKPERKQLDLQQVQQDLLKLQDHVKSQDSLFQQDTLLKKHN